jgi:hypothetical protein
VRLDDTARERCCAAVRRNALVQRHEWGRLDATGIEGAGRSTVAGLDSDWQRVANQAM